MVIFLSFLLEPNTSVDARATASTNVLGSSPSLYGVLITIVAVCEAIRTYG
jgi:hypothetical protein